MKADIYKEPALDVNKMRIKDEGSLGGLFVTLFGFTLAVILIAYSIGFYNDYSSMDLSRSAASAAQPIDRNVGFNNDNTMKFMANGFGHTAGEAIVRGSLLSLFLLLFEPSSS
jgi:hypothetical protein